SGPARVGRRRAVRFAPEHAPAVRAFNQRLARAGARWRFPETSVPDWLPQADGVPVWQEYFLLLEDDAVRGAYVLKRQDAVVGRGAAGVASRRVGSFYWPLSEGTIDPTYALVAPRLLQAALQEEPLLFLVGMVGRDRPIARLVRALGWRLTSVPFYFKPVRPARFFRELRYGRRRAGVRFALDLASATGVAWLGLTLAGLALRAGARRPAPVRIDEVQRFGDWADVIWAANAPRYSFVGGRDAAALNATYPPDSGAFIRLRIARGDGAIGWAVVQDSLPGSSEHFGGMRVGTIVDTFAAPEDATAVVRASCDALTERRVDLIISNQSHRAWRRALSRAGFLRGPSSWLFAPSPALAELVFAVDPAGRAIHLNRGDGDWPWGTGLEGPALPATS
ncbi:MAG TPA: hypothetical protein VIV88_18505, partial [Gemmatimonadales bacterium]